MRASARQKTQLPLGDQQHRPVRMNRIAPEITAKARALRSGATAEERKVWHMLSRYRPRFTRQLPIGPYIADFACRQAKLIVELDGSQHVDQAAQDAERILGLGLKGGP